MRTIGFPISRKENEKRRALIPNDLLKIKNVEYLYFESGYGDVLGFSDEEYIRYGANIGSREDILCKDIICDPKVGDAEYLKNIRSGQIVFGWVHAVQNKDITDSIVNNSATAIAWEDMFEKGRHIFAKNNEIAGVAGVLHACQVSGIFPEGKKVAIIGRGNTAMGAYSILSKLGASIDIYTRNSEDLLRDKIKEYDIIINAVLWDINRKDHIIYKENLNDMKKNSMIIDISCDRNGAIETSIPTTIQDPVYYVDGVMHYVVDHTPSIYHKETSKELSVTVCEYIDRLIEDDFNDVLRKAVIIKGGIIMDERIIKFQKR